MKDKTILRTRCRGEAGSGDGFVTNWRAAVLLCLTASQVAKMRGMSLLTAKSHMNHARKMMKSEGWEFLPSDASPQELAGGNVSPFLPPIAPPGQAPEVIRAEISRAEQWWQTEVNRQMRSTWGARIAPGKAPGN